GGWSVGDANGVALAMHAALLYAAVARLAYDWRAAVAVASAVWLSTDGVVGIVGGCSCQRIQAAERVVPKREARGPRMRQVLPAGHDVAHRGVGIDDFGLQLFEVPGFHGPIFDR